MSGAQIKLVEMMDNNSSRGNGIKPHSISQKPLAGSLNILLIYRVIAKQLNIGFLNHIAVLEY
jgi:hypothetical protein